MDGNIYKISEIERCIKVIKQEQQVQKGYTFTDVIKILHIGEKKAKKLMNMGILVPIEVIENKAGRRLSYFTKIKIEKSSSFLKLVDV